MRNFDDFLNEIFNELKIETKLRKILKKLILISGIPKFNKKIIIDFINVNKQFLQK